VSVKKPLAEPSECEASTAAHETDAPLESVADAVGFLEDAADTLLRLIWLYRETLFGDTPVPLEERRRMMSEAERRAELDCLCDRIPLALAGLTPSGRRASTAAH
jgi:hypothetical protein